MSPMVKCQEYFAMLDKDMIKITKIFKITYDTNLSTVLDWGIPYDTVHHSNNDFIPPECLDVSADINFEAIFDQFAFTLVFPDLKGHGKIINKFLSNPCATYHDTVYGVIKSYFMMIQQKTQIGK